MITCEQVTDRQYSCDNCNLEMPLVLQYRFSNGGREYVRLTLCEDCSCALSNLHFKVMEEGKPHKYDLDEITGVDGSD